MSAWLLGSPKALLAGIEAVGLFLWGIAYAKAHKTDGVIIERAALTALAGKKNKVLADRLVRAELWQRIDGGFLICEWDKHGPRKRKPRALRVSDSPSAPPSSEGAASKSSRERVAKWREKRRSSMPPPMEHEAVTCNALQAVTSVTCNALQAVTPEEWCGVSAQNHEELHAPNMAHDGALHPALHPPDGDDRDSLARTRKISLSYFPELRSDQDQDLPGRSDQSADAPGSVRSDEPAQPASERQPTPKPETSQDAPGTRFESSKPPTPQEVSKDAPRASVAQANSIDEGGHPVKMGRKAALTPPDWWADCIEAVAMVVGDVPDPLLRWLEYDASRERKTWVRSHTDAVPYVCAAARSAKAQMRRDEERAKASSNRYERKENIRQPMTPGGMAEIMKWEKKPGEAPPAKPKDDKREREAIVRAMRLDAWLRLNARWNEDLDPWKDRRCFDMVCGLIPDDMSFREKEGKVFPDLRTTLLRRKNAPESEWYEIDARTVEAFAMHEVGSMSREEYDQAIATHQK